MTVDCGAPTAITGPEALMRLTHKPKKTVARGYGFFAFSASLSLR